MRDETTVRSIQRAMTRISRSMGRHDLSRQVERVLGSRLDTSLLHVTGAIDELTGSSRIPTIKDIARHLDVHASRASRLVKDTIRAGLVRRLASQEDARKSPLALTEKGLEIAAAIHAARAKFYVTGLDGFSRPDCRNLAQLLERFAENQSPGHQKPGRSGAEAGDESSAAKRRRRKRKRSAAG